MLKLETHNAFNNMALDEAILQARVEENVPNTLRLYRWQPSAVSIGRFQNIYNEVNLDNCRSHVVDVVRRMTGGGAVYHDSQDEITYGVIVKREDIGTHDIAEVYDKICNGLVEAIRILGIDAEYGKGNVKKCPNITIKDRKISGSAQAHKKGVVLQHGTLLIDVNVEKMYTFLKAPNTSVDIVSIAKRKITSVAHELGSSLPIERAYDALAKGFEKAFSIQLSEGSITSYEADLAQRLEKEKYATSEWNFEGKHNKLFA